jgi:hypothetical protein
LEVEMMTEFLTKGSQESALGAPEAIPDVAAHHES